MRTPKTLKTLLLSALFATAALGASASATQVYLQNEDSGLTRTVDVYVDGKLMFDDVSPGAFTVPVDLSGGQHEVVVTTAGLVAGSQDLFRSTINLPQNGTYTLTYGESQSGTGVSQPTLGLTVGNGEARE